MKNKINLWARRLALRWLRKLVDLADDRLHAAEVNFREQSFVGCLSGGSTASEAGRKGERSPGTTAPRETFQKWEARRSGVAVITKKEARRRRGLTAAQFDRRFYELQKSAV